jgi:phosphopantothenoylcysteine decarboxylase/phosphopantothenate--cysteine ligase
MSRIVVAVGGSVAAWKACALTSKLVQAGHVVDVVLSEHALWFVTPLAFSSLTQRKAFTDENWGAGTTPAEHLAVTRDADALVVAPCTANLLGKFAHGIADDLVTTTWLGAGCPTLVAPAMNARMWRHPRVRANVAVLEGDGVRFVGPESGWLAEGEEGPGRMAEPERVVEAIDALLREGRASDGSRT